MAIPQYPDSFPCPMVQGYSGSTDMGVLRFESETGRSRQRRTHNTMPTQIQMQFAMRRDDFTIWINWVNQFAYDWVLFPAVTLSSGGGNPHDNPQIIRFTSNVEWQALTDDAIQATVQAETAPEGATATGQTGLWIVARRPGNPAVSIILSGTPGNPAVP